MSENGCEKWHFLALSRVRIWITGRHTPTKNSQEYPPPPLGIWSNCPVRNIRTTIKLFFFAWWSPGKWPNSGLNASQVGRIRFRWIMLSVMISDSSRDYALSHLQYSKTMQTNHNLGILHSPGDSEKMPADVFIDWRCKLVESKNIEGTLWAVLCVTSRHVLRWKTPPKHQVTTFYQHTWHWLQIPEGIWSTARRFIAQGCALRKVTAFSKNTYLNTPTANFALSEEDTGRSEARSNQADRQGKMTNIRFPAS